MTDIDEFFVGGGPIDYVGPESDNPLSFQWYDAERSVAGKRMEDHLRVAACYWHSFLWSGSDVFGAGTLDRPWTAPDLDRLAAARLKMAAAFELPSWVSRSSASTTAT